MEIGISCIYKITNIKNGKIYIGQTKSIERRHSYPSNYKYCTSLYEDIKQHGWFNFKREIIETVSPEYLDEKELHWINTLKPEYNIRGDKESINAIAESTKIKMRQAKKGKDSGQKKVLCLDTGKVFDSITSAAEFAGCDKIAISRVCRGIYKSAKGYKWEWV